MRRWASSLRRVASSVAASGDESRALRRAVSRRRLARARVVVQAVQLARRGAGEHVVARGRRRRRVQRPAKRISSRRIQGPDGNLALRPSTHGRRRARRRRGRPCGRCGRYHRRGSRTVQAHDTRTRPDRTPTARVEPGAAEEAAPTASSSSAKTKPEKRPSANASNARRTTRPWTACASR